MCPIAVGELCNKQIQVLPFFSQESKNSIFDLNRATGGRANPIIDLQGVPRLTYQNFIDAIRANDASKLNSNILDGHLSSALPHLANIAYRVGESLVFDRKSETFVDNKKADKLLTREYRKGFEIPKSFPVKETASRE